MARPSTVSIFLKRNRWFIRFQKIESGKKKRIEKACKTSDESTAKAIKHQVEGLLSNPALKASSQAHFIFFGEYPVHYNEEIADELDKYDGEVSDEYIMADLTERVTFLEKENKSLKSQLSEITKKYEAIKNTQEGRMIDQIENMPTIEAALNKYLEFIKHLARYRRNYYNFIETFFKDIGLDNKIHEVQASQISDYLHEDSLGNSAPGARWMRQRKQFTKFFNWACSNWPFQNPMDLVKTKKVKAKEDVHWHNIKEVDSLLEEQKDIYNKALLSVLFFSGVSAHEFRGLKLQDYFELSDKWFLRVSPNECRGVKAAKRIRNINVNERLKTILDEYLETHSGGPALFPPKVCKEGRDYWHEDTLSRYLNNEVFPEGMNCLSARRTFGSLLLRSGKTVAEVSAAMGNSIKMVEAHYARIIANEVEIGNF